MSHNLNWNSHLKSFFSEININDDLSSKHKFNREHSKKCV